MKLKYVILFAIILTSCTTTDLATDNQIDWCISRSRSINFVANSVSGKSSDTKSETINLIIYWETALNRVAKNMEIDPDDVLNIDYNTIDPNSLFQDFQNLLEEDGEDFMRASRVCKIWEELSN